MDDFLKYSSFADAKAIELVDEIGKIDLSKLGVVHSSECRVYHAIMTLS